MKPCCVCTIVGVTVGMIFAAYLVTTNRKVENFVDESKKAINRQVKKIKKNISDKD